MTGAQIPNGCDAVVMLELTRQYEEDGNKYMEVKRHSKRATIFLFKVKMLVEARFLQRKGHTFIQVFQLFLLRLGIARYRWLESL